MKRKGQTGVFFLSILFVSVFVGVSIAPGVFDSKTDAVVNGEYLGEITDFVVTGNGDTCTVETDKGKYGVRVTATGSDFPCRNLETGKHLYRHSSFLLEEHYHVAERGRQ